MRPTELSRVTVAAACLAVSIALLLVQPDVASAQLPFEPLLRITRGTIGGPPRGIELVTSQAELLAVWKVLGGRTAPPLVDFRRHSAIFYFDGSKSTGGYSVDIERVEIRGGDMEVDVVETVPGTNCGTTQEATSPIVAVLTIPWKGRVAAVVRTAADNCN